MLNENDVRNLREALGASPLPFLDNILGCSYWGKQEEIAWALWRYPRVAVKSCHASGKTYITAALILDFLYSHPNSIVISTAPTFRQVKDLTWREIAGFKARSHVPLGGILNKTSLELSDNWYAMGFATNNTNNAQGFHAKSGWILVVVEEASGVSEEMFEALSAILTSENSRLLLIGNPTVPHGEFFNSFGDSSFHHISIPAYVTPNFTENGILSRQDLQKFSTREEVAALPVKHPYLVTPLWAWERMKKLGVDHPMFVSRVEANFPTEAENTLIAYWSIESSLTRIPDEDEESAYEGANVLGIDVARFGNDSSVLIALKASAMVDCEDYHGKDTMQIVGAAEQMFERNGFIKSRDFIGVDDTGVGGGVSDRLSERGFKVVRVNFGSSPSDKKKYVNLKAQMYDYLKETMDGGFLTIMDIPELVRDFRSAIYWYTSDQKMAIISKEDLKKKGIPSPDWLDALIIANWVRYSGGVAVPKQTIRERPDQMITGNIMDENF